MAHHYVRNSRVGLWGVLLYLMSAGPAHSQEGKAAPLEQPRLTIPRLEGSVRIDAALDEPQWQQAARVTDYHPFEPVEVGEAPGRTEALLFYDQTNLYLGFRCYTDKPGSIRAHIAPREDINADDQVGIYLDTYDDHLQAFVFYLNALGIQQDARLIEGSGWNQSWDTVLHSKGRVEGDHFVVEVAIPFRSLRFPNAEKQTWGLILTRKFAAEGAKFIWPKVTREVSNFVGQAATLEGIEGISSGRHLELQPTLVTQLGDGVNAAEDQLLAPLNFQLKDRLSLAPGLSVKYGLTSNLTLDATVNPDFSQIEADPDQLDANVRFALYVAERRPFFLEGSETLSGAPYLSLHSRSIVSPLWGLKLTGKQGRTSIGLLTAYDTAPQPSFTRAPLPVGAETPGAIRSAETPGFESGDLTNEDGSSRGAMVSVARVSRDVGTDSNIGATLVDKEIVEPFSRQAFGYHRYAALDARLQFGQHDRLIVSGEYNVTGMRGGDQIDGAGYFLGYRHTTRKFYFQVNHGYESPEFRAEASFLPVVGVLFTDVYTQYMFEPKLKGIVFIYPQLYVNAFYEPVVTDEVIDRELVPSLYARLAGQNYLSLAWSEHQVRENGIDYPEHGLRLSFQSSTFNALAWEVGGREGTRIYYGDLYDPAASRDPESVVGYSFSPYVSMTLRPSARLLGTFAYQRDVFLDSPMLSPVYAVNYLGGGETPDLRYDQSVLRGVVSMNFSADWSLRLIGQRSATRYPTSADGQLDGSALLTYLPHPGTAAYLGASYCLALDETSCSAGADAWRVFFKLSYLWRV